MCKQQQPVPRGPCSSQCAAASTDSRGARTKRRSCRVVRSSACAGDGGGSSRRGRACCSCRLLPRCLASRTGVLPPRIVGRARHPYQSSHRGLKRASSQHWQQLPSGLVAAVSAVTLLLRVLSAARAAVFVDVAAALAAVAAAAAVRCAPPLHCRPMEDEMAEGYRVSGRFFSPSRTLLVSCGPHN